MFGFGQVASFDYFAHVKRALAARFENTGLTLALHVVDVLPTASVRRRAVALAELIAQTAEGDEAIHLLGHSTGGLDARLVASPGAALPHPSAAAAWLPRLRSVTTMNTPHYGTPLATFFATTRGQQALYLLSAFTYIGLSLGARPLTLASIIVGILARGDQAIGIKLPFVNSSIDSVLAMVNDARNPNVRKYLSAIKQDSRSMIQLTPEGMDLVLAGFRDRPGVRYFSTVSMAPSVPLKSWLGSLVHPIRASSLALFTALHAITGQYDSRYPCSAMSEVAGQPAASEQQQALLTAALGDAADLRANDGVVPIRSQLWGELIWAGLGDHLDVLGHYADNMPKAQPELAHHDWLTSGSAFGDTQFESLMDAIVAGMLR